MEFENIDNTENEERLEVIDAHYQNAIDSIAEYTAMGLRGIELHFYHQEVYPTILARLAMDGIKYQVVDRQVVNFGGGDVIQVTVLLVW